MLLDKSDPRDVPSSGIYIQSPLQEFSALDFTRARAIIDSGYFQTIRQMPEIKSKISLRKPCEEISVERNKFNSKAPPILVENIKFEGFKKSQELYLNRFFKRGKRLLYYEDIKTGYYKLVSEPFFNSIYPRFNFNRQRQNFDFDLIKRKTAKIVER